MISSSQLCFATQKIPNIDKIKIFSTSEDPAENEAPHAALKQFSQLVSRLSRKFDKKSKHHTHLAYAQVYFNDLYTHGTKDTQKTLTLLAFELENVLSMKSWSTEKKYLAFNTFLTNALGDIELTLKTKIEKEKLQELYLHLQAGISPTIMGRQEALRKLPWVKMVLWGSLISGGVIGYRSGALGRAKNQFIKSFETLSHIGDNIKEASRDTDAFYANIEKDGKGYATRRQHISNDGTVHEIEYLRAQRGPSGEEIWVKKPAGIADRLVSIAEKATPLLPHLTQQAQDAAAQQAKWFKMHNITTDATERLWVPVTVIDEDGQEKEEMRYAEDSGKNLQDLNLSEQEARNASYWHDKATDLWHKTHLPERNSFERALNTADRLVKLTDTPEIKNLIARLTTDLNNSEEELVTFLRTNNLLKEGANKPWQLQEGVTLTINPETKKLVYHKKGQGDVNAPESSFDRLITTANKLLDRIEDEKSAAGSLVRTLMQSMEDGRQETLEWLRDNGLTDSNGKRLKGVETHTDEVTGNIYYTKAGVFEDDDSGEGPAGAGGPTPERKLKRFYQTSPTGNLFNALGRIAREQGVDINALVDHIFEEVDYLAEYHLSSAKGFLENTLSQISFPTFTAPAQKLDGKIEEQLNAPIELAVNQKLQAAKAALMHLKSQSIGYQNLLSTKEDKTELKIIERKIRTIEKHITKGALAIEKALETMRKRKTELESIPESKRNKTYKTELANLDEEIRKFQKEVSSTSPLPTTPSRK